MSHGRWIGYLAVLTVVAGLAACGDYTASTSPPQKKSLSAPRGAVHSRYILISGVWTCVEECEAGDPGVEGFPSGSDSLTVGGIPADSVSVSSPLPPDVPPQTP